MSGDTLRVTTAHLRDLAVQQQKAATDIRGATHVIEGVDTAVRISHGVIAWSTAAAVEAIQNARRRSANAMAEESEGIRDRLFDAATRYDQVDGAIGVRLDSVMPPR
jgi:Excreted virulence factor EspC, type VII ESX diderm